MSRIFIIILIASLALPQLSSANCFDYDITKSEMTSLEFRQIWGMTDYSKCSNPELQKMIEGAKSQSQVYLNEIPSGGSIYLSYLALAKASLSLMEIEVSKRK